MRNLGNILGIVVLGLLAGATRAAPSPGPSIAVDAPVLDLGAVHRGEKIEGRFHVRNAGTETLSISDARPACGCTVATFDREIAPGKSGEVRAIVDTKTFSGPITKSVSLISNDPVHPQLTLTIKATVQP